MLILVRNSPKTQADLYSPFVPASLTTAILFHQIFEVRVVLSAHGRPSLIGIAGSLSRYPDSICSATSWPTQRRHHMVNHNITSLVCNYDAAGYGHWIGSVRITQRRPGSAHVYHSLAGLLTDVAAPMMLVQGLLSAISASMLIYAGTVEMLAGDFIFGSLQGDHEHSHGHGGHSDHGGDEPPKEQVGVGKQALAVASLLLGVIGMELVGLGE